jgi:hypothetical protein
MKVLLLNGSPRAAGATTALLEALAGGMESAGAETHTVELRGLGLHECVGCFNCWVHTPGRCVQHDAMETLLAEYDAADLLVFGTPLYIFGMTGLMKVFLDRTIPLIKPWLIAGVEGVTTHPRRHPRTPRQQAILVSPCGFPERAHFDALVATFRLMATHLGWDWRGELLRPSGEMLANAALRPLVAPYLALVAEAGAALVREGQIPPPIDAALQQDLVPGGPEALRARANQHWTAMMERWQVPLDATGSSPRRTETLDAAAETVP